MSMTRMRKIGWAAVLLVCCALYLALHLRVNAVKSEVRRAEAQIIALQQEKLLLETEFQTRANQQQLALWNDVEFGYQAPTADQFLGGERQLAQFGTPRAKGAPEPIRVASAAPEVEEDSAFAEVTAALSAEARAADQPEREAGAPIGRENLSARLMRGAARIAIDEMAEGAE